MKHRTIRFFLLLPIMLILFHCSKNPVNTLFYIPLPETDDSAIPDSVKGVYYEDAASLVLRETLIRGSSSVTLPEDRINTVYSGLIHIFNARHLDARNAVVQTHHIHAAPDPHPRRIMVKFDSSAVWADNWQHNIPESSNKALTELMTTYNISIPVYYFWGEFHVAYLQTEKPVNTMVLARMFRNIKGIIETQELYEPSETDIRVTTGSYYWNFRFSLNPSQYWNFFIYRDGTVTSVSTD